MASGDGVSLLSSFDKERSALDAVLASRAFSKSPRLAALLSYLCTRFWNGDGDSIKEYNIAIDVFGRPPDFDQTSDAIVRVEIHRLRKKLQQFYDSEGAAEPVRITIQPGRYIPEFSGLDEPSAPLDAAPPPDHAPPLETAPPPPPAASAPAAPAPASRPSWPWAALIAALCLLLAFAFLWRPAASARVAARTTVHAPALPVPAGAPIRILCGASSPLRRDRSGRSWSPDAYFSGGTPVASPVSLLYRTRDYRLYSSSRRGEFSYRIPLAPGVYELHLYFADTSFTPGVTLEGGESTRVFQVFLNGNPLLRDFDIISDSAPATADVRVFKDVTPAPDGFLHLRFVKTISEPLINAIEILPSRPHRLLPIRLLTQDQPFTDSEGNQWMPDDYYLYGRLTARTGLVRGARDPELYGVERYGNFSYAIPVDQGVYSLTLHFAESYFGPQSSGGGGAGSRIFTVSSNGVPLLANFDMFAEAGNRAAITRTFHGLRPNAQGKLLIAFTPTVNYASLSALEVEDETP